MLEKEPILRSSVIISPVDLKQSHRDSFLHDDKSKNAIAIKTMLFRLKVYLINT